MDVNKLKEWLDTDEGKADLKEYFDKIAGRDVLTQGRYKRFEEWLDNNDFDILMYRLILEHGDEYQQKCYDNGYMPHPNNKLSFIIGYVTRNLASINVTEIDCDFANEIWQYKGYYFQHIHGQGTIFRLYNKDDLRLLLQV